MLCFSIFARKGLRTGRKSPPLGGGVCIRRNVAGNVCFWCNAVDENGSDVDDKQGPHTRPLYIVTNDVFKILFCLNLSLLKVTNVIKLFTNLYLIKLVILMFFDLLNITFM